MKHINTTVSWIQLKHMSRCQTSPKHLTSVLGSLKHFIWSFISIAYLSNYVELKGVSTTLWWSCQEIINRKIGYFFCCLVLSRGWPWPCLLSGIGNLFPIWWPPSPTVFNRLPHFCFSSFCSCASLHYWECKSSVQDLTMILWLKSPEETLTVSIRAFWLCSR